MKKNKRGSTLALCIIIMSILSMFVIAMGGILITRQKASQSELSYEKSFYLVDSCIAATQRELQNRISIILTKTLGEVGFDDVPVVYTDDEGNTQVYPADDFKDMFTDYVMRKFSTSAVREQMLMNYLPRNPSDPTDYTKATDSLGNLTYSDILGSTLNASLTGITAPDQEDASSRYNIKTEIEYKDNMAYGDFSSRYRRNLSKSRKDYLEDIGLGLNFSSSDYSAWTASDEKSFDRGHTVITYTITHPNSAKVEKVRVQYTFDMYSQLKEICDKHAALVYSAGTSNILPENPGNSSGGPVEATYSISLDTKVIREFLAD